MKKISLLICLLMLLSFTACSGILLPVRSIYPVEDSSAAAQADSLAGSPSLQNRPDPIIKSDNTADSNTSVTKPEPEKKPFRFIVMADSRGSNKGINSSIVKKTMEQIKKLTPQPEFAVLPGDLVDGSKTYAGVKAQLEYFKKTVTNYYPADFFFPGIGNHEVMNSSGGEKAFGEVFTEFKATFCEGYGRTSYFFDWGNSRFFMLDSSFPGEGRKVSDKQRKWAGSNIDTKKEHNFFFTHEPSFPTGSGVGSSLDAFPLKRNQLWQLIDSTKSSMVFCGHEHNYTRRHIDSSFNSKVGGIEFKYGRTIYQVTTGSFGAPLYKQYTSKKNVDVAPVPQYHYAVVDVGTNIKVTVYNLEGKILDSFEQ